MKLAGNLNAAGRTELVGTVTKRLHMFVFICKEKMPTCLVPDCNNSSELGRVRSVTFHNLPVDCTARW